MRLRSFLLTLSQGLLLVAVAAQEPTLLSVGNAAVNASGLPLLEIDGSCRSTSRCQFDPALFATRVQAPAGGLAYDALTRRTYATDGTTLVVLDEACGLLQSCPIPLVASPPWTGLALDATGTTLYFTTAASTNVFTIATTCPLGVPRLVCTVPPVGTGGPFTGIDVDPWDGTLWLTDALGNVFHVDGAGTITGTYRTSCPTQPAFRPIHGLAIDRARNAIYLADDRGGILKRSLASATFDCCVGSALPSGFHLIGLARVPAAATTLGDGCSQGSCPTCIPHAVLRSPAILPNANFSIGLRDASAGNVAFLLMSPPSPPNSLPGFCTPLHVSLVPAPLFLGPLPTVPMGGSAPCSGGASLPLPLPLEPSFCGATVHAQWMVGCLGAGNALGLQISNGLAITIS